MSNKTGNFISNNVRDIRSSEKRLKIFEYLKNDMYHGGFAFFQETHSSTQNEKSGKMISKILCFSYMVVPILVY